MARCKACGCEMIWAQLDGRWVPLEPLVSSADLPKRFVDEHGELRADHRDGCNGTGGEAPVMSLRKLESVIYPAASATSRAADEVAKRVDP